MASVAAGISLIAATSLPANPAYADSIRDQEWHLRSVNALQTRSITTGSGVTVAVIDTGTFPHPDLRKNLLSGTDEISASGNGQDDRQGHGTRMAALIAGHGAAGNKGIQGIAPSAKILPIRVAADAEAKSSDAIAKGIVYATDQGASVINVSMAGGPDFDLEDAINRALERNVVVIAGVGNAPRDLVIGYPAANDGVLAVGATGRDGKHASVSVKDAKVQICAPGVDIISAVPKAGYGLATGTSDSTAIVSGAAALVRAKFPNLSARDVINRLTSTADDIGPAGRDNECGFGRLNVYKALTADVPPLQGSTASAPSGSATSASSAAPGYIDPAATTAPGPQAEAEPASSSTPLVLGGVLFGLVVAGGLVAAFVIRRRRSF
jgi:type VII secretion-associated serine protease mycosin